MFFDFLRLKVINKRSWLTLWLTAGVIGWCDPSTEEVPFCEPCIKSCRDKRYRRWCPEQCTRTQKCYCKYGFLQDDMGRCVPEDMCFTGSKTSEYNNNRGNDNPLPPSPTTTSSNTPSGQIDLKLIPHPPPSPPSPHLIRLLMIEDGHPYHFMHDDHIHPDVHHDIHEVHLPVHVWENAVNTQLTLTFVLTYTLISRLLL